VSKPRTLYVKGKKSLESSFLTETDPEKRESEDRGAPPGQRGRKRLLEISLDGGRHLQKGSLKEKKNLATGVKTPSKLSGETVKKEQSGRETSEKGRS